MEDIYHVQERLNSLVKARAQWRKKERDRTRRNHQFDETPRLIDRYGGRFSTGRKRERQLRRLIPLQTGCPIITSTGSVYSRVRHQPPFASLPDATTRRRPRPETQQIGVEAGIRLRNHHHEHSHGFWTGLVANSGIFINCVPVHSASSYQSQQFFLDASLCAVLSICTLLLEANWLSSFQLNILFPTFAIAVW